MLPIKFLSLLIVFFMTMLVSTSFAGTNSHQENKGPGFDCAKARTITERTICSDTELSSQDRQLFETYYAVPKPLVGKPYANLINTQHIFLNERNRCKDDKLCIQKITSTKIDQLKALYGKQISANCSDEAKQYSLSWGMSAEEAFNFGVKIQKIVKAKDLQALFGLVDGELKNGPRKAYVKDKKFDDVFSPDWRRKVLMDEAPCSPTGWRGFMLGAGLIWYNNDGGWNIFAINDALESKEKATEGVWLYKGKKLTATCFRIPWMSGDFYEFYLDTYIKDKNVSFYDAKKYIGRHIGKEIPIGPVLWDEETVSFGVNIKECTSASSNKDITYQVEKSIPQRFCKVLAPNYPKTCHQLRLVEVTGPCGGSMGCDVNYAIYGIVDNPKAKETYVVPLVNLETLNDALNFVDELEK